MSAAYPSAADVVRSSTLGHPSGVCEGARVSGGAGSFGPVGIGSGTPSTA